MKNPRLLWTTKPELLAIRWPTAIFTDLRRDAGKRFLELHPTLIGTDAGGPLGTNLGGLPLFSFADDAPEPSFAFQSPGEGAWRVYPRVELRRAKAISGFLESRLRAGVVGAALAAQRRIDVVVEAAAELAGGLGRDAVVWHLSDNGLGSGLLGIGAAKALGTAVVCSTGRPDVLSLAAMNKHGVSLEAVYNMSDALAAVERMKGA